MTQNKSEIETIYAENTTLIEYMHFYQVFLTFMTYYVSS